MPELTAEDLKQHLKLLSAASTEDLDELLHDLLVKVYPTKITQDSETRPRRGAAPRRPVFACAPAPGRPLGRAGNVRRRWHPPRRRP